MPTSPAAQQVRLPGIAPDSRPFVKWVGGKRRLLHKIKPMIPEHFGRYHEPFVGGGALFFHLASRRNPGPETWATLSDANRRLVRTYRAVRDEPERLVARLADFENEHSKEHFYAIRALDPDSFVDDVEVAAWFIYLNKTAFNGLYRVNSKGKFNVPIGRYDRPNICDTDAIRTASVALQGAEIHHEGFESVLERAEPGDVVYFDPPYVPASKTANFRNYTRDGFTLEDQTRLRDVAAELKLRGLRVILSNSDTPVVRDLYRSGFDLHTVKCGRSINSKASARGRVGELLIT
jgi:DNA adenine methylase